MAALTSTTLSATGVNAVTVNTLTSSDTFAYDATRNQILELRNGTGGALTPNLLGNAVTPVIVGGLGSVSTASGYTTTSIAAGATVTIVLNTIAAYLKGTSVTVTGGTGISATLYRF